MLPDLGPVRANEHIADKQAVPCILADHPDGLPVAGVRAREAVLHKQVLALQKPHHALIKAVESFLFKGPVDGAPPDVALAAGFLHDKLVIWRAAGVISRADHQRPEVSGFPLVALESLLVQRSGRKVPIDMIRIRNAVLFNPICAGIPSLLVHSVTPKGGKTISAVWQVKQSSRQLLAQTPYYKGN